MENGKRAFTLLEVMIASLLLAWIIVGMFNIYTSSQKMMSKSNHVREALALARDKLEELSGVGYDAFTTNPQYQVYVNSQIDAPQTTLETKDQLTQQFPNNEFVKNYAKQRKIVVTNKDDWETGGDIDYRKIEVTVEWDEPT